MSAPTVFVIKNQTGLFLNKQMEWIEGGDGHTLYRTAHRDEAVNTVFEVSAKDMYLRAETVACPVDAKGQPAVRRTDLLTAAATAPAAANDVDSELVIADDAIADDPTASALAVEMASAENALQDAGMDDTQPTTESNPDASADDAVDHP
jgi:hypothetical protein